jgi:hypothetical protein
MMSDMERHEWLLRENEIEKLQNLRIELLEKMLKDNETHQYDASIERINRQWSKKQVKREEFVKTNRLHYLRGMKTIFSLFIYFFLIKPFELYFENEHKSKQNMFKMILYEIIQNMNHQLMVH